MKSLPSELPKKLLHTCRVLYSVKEFAQNYCCGSFGGMHTACWTK